MQFTKNIKFLWIRAFQARKNTASEPRREAVFWLKWWFWPKIGLFFLRRARLRSKLLFCATTQIPSRMTAGRGALYKSASSSAARAALLLLGEGRREPQNDTSIIRGSSLTSSSAPRELGTRWDCPTNHKRAKMLFGEGSLRGTLFQEKGSPHL